LEDLPASFIRRALADAGFPLSDAEVGLFATYLRELSRWNERTNLTAVRDQRKMVTTLIAESLSFALGYDFSRPSRVLDVGSGAGLPGVPLKIKFPQITLTLLESRAKKVAFLKHIVRTLGLGSTTCLCAHTSELSKDAAFAETLDAVVTRGTGPLRRIVPAVAPFLREGGRFICRKGRDYEEEVRLASRQIRSAKLRLVEAIPLPSGKRRGGVLLVLEKCST